MNAAESRVLVWARSNPRGQGTPALRLGRKPGKECLVLDVGKFDCDEIASGPTWEAVELALVERGLMKAPTNHSMLWWNTKPKMMPGETPYTEAEQAQLSALLGAACEAEDRFSADELEAFAARHAIEVSK